MRNFIETFDRQFAKLHRSSCSIIPKLPPERLFSKPTEDFQGLSCAEYILRSAGKVEQTFGGIATRLWDDPFEWTLPEELSSAKKIVEYLEEVEATRLRGFAYFKIDDDLKKELPAPEELKPLFELLIDTLCEAQHLQGRAISVYQMDLRNREM